MQFKEYEFKRDEHGTPITANVFYQKDSTKGLSGAVAEGGAGTGTLRAKKPIAIVLHGGGFVVGSKDNVPRNQIDVLVNDYGFVVVVPDYRLCPTVSLYDGPVTDTRDCFTWMQEQLPGLIERDSGDGEGDAAVLVDPGKIVAMGYSAGGTLALLLAAMPQPPLAILDFYGPCFFSDPFFHSPLAAAAQTPDLPKEFLDKVYDEGTVTSSASIFLEADPYPDADTDPEPPSSAAARGVRPTKIDFSRPRVAWLFTGFKQGWLIREIVGDDDYSRVDPATLFPSSSSSSSSSEIKKFPPTCFIHGTADKMVDVKFSKRAHAQLKEAAGAGVETEILLVDGEDHGFDSRLEKGDVSFETYVREGLAFLARHVVGLD